MYHMCACHPGGERKEYCKGQTLPAHMPAPLSAGIRVLCCARLPRTLTGCLLPGAFPVPLGPALLPAWPAPRAGTWMTAGTALKQHTGVHVPIALLPCPTWCPLYTSPHKSPSGVKLQPPIVVPGWQCSIHWLPFLPILVPLLCSPTGFFTSHIPKQTLFVSMSISQIRKLRLGNCKPPPSMNTDLPGCGVLAVGHV